MFRRMLAWMFVPMAFAAGLTGATAHGCPFCSRVDTTVGSQVDDADVAAIATAREDAQPAPDATGPVEATQPFHVIDVLKGEDVLDGAKVVEVPFVHPVRRGDLFLLSARRQPVLLWNYPLPIDSATADYLVARQALPGEGARRVAFQFNHLESDAAPVAQAAYKEFADMPFEKLVAARSALDRDRIVRRLQSDKVSARNKRLYLTMLGICGSEEDLPLVEAMMAAGPQSGNVGLDALLGCYISLKGPPGLDDVASRYLDNPQAGYAETVPAVAALRFHGDQQHVVSRDRVRRAFHSLLERPAYADLVIDDLMRWGDWSVVDKLVELYEDADEDAAFVRIPILHYLMACPLPKANERLGELAARDPQTYQHARSIAPFGREGDSGRQAAAVGDPGEIAPGPSNGPPGAGSPDAARSTGEGPPREPAVPPTRDGASGTEPSKSDKADALALLMGLPLLGAVIVALAVLKAWRSRR